MKIEQYVQKADIKTPLATSPPTFANCGIGDRLFIIDNKVWTRNWSNKDENEFELAWYIPDFVRANSADNGGCFEKVN